MAMGEAKNMPPKNTLKKPIHFHLMPYFPGAVKKQAIKKCSTANHFYLTGVNP